MQVRGRTIDDETRCVHYRSELDVVAFRFKCCGDWYPCAACHDEAVDHEAEQWSADERDRKAVLCGVCGSTMPIGVYVESGHECPTCSAPFNPGCPDHWDRYFEV